MAFHQEVWDENVAKLRRHREKCPYDEKFMDSIIAVDDLLKKLPKTYMTCPEHGMYFHAPECPQCLKTNDELVPEHASLRAENNMLRTAIQKHMLMACLNTSKETQNEADRALWATVKHREVTCVGEPEMVTVASGAGKIRCGCGWTSPAIQDAYPDSRTKAYDLYKEHGKTCKHPLSCEERT